MRKKVIIVGAGHNGLVAANYLARAGLDVTVLESRPIVGGAAVTEELIPGFRMSSCSFVVGLLRPEVIADLELTAHGLELYLPDEAISCTIHEGGEHFFLWRDVDRTLREVREKFGARDLEGFIRFGLDLQALGGLLEPTLLAPPPRLSDLVRRFEESGNQLLFERFLTGSVRDLVAHYFESETLRGHFIFPGVVSMHGGPSSPGTAYLLAHHCVGEFLGQFGQWGFARGGMGSITAALARSAAQSGVRIHTSVSVKRIKCRRGCVEAVETDRMGSVDADVVVSNADPKRTFFSLIERSELPRSFIEEMESYDVRGSMGRVYIAVDELPAFTGVGTSQKGPEHEGHIFLGPTTEVFEAGWDQQRRGRIPEDFAVELLIDTVRDPTLAPPGKHVLVAGIQQLPFELAGTDWDAQKERLTQAVIRKINRFAPNLQAHIVGVRCHTPLDWERTYGLTGGNIFQGAMSLSRIMAGRPGGLRNGYAAPVKGLYLCGAGTHPGGGVMGASGFNSAMAVLTDLGLPTPRPWIPMVGDRGLSNPGTGLLHNIFKYDGMRRLVSAAATQAWTRPIARFLTRRRPR